MSGHATVERLVVGGRVACPLQGDLDAEKCLQCTWVRGVRRNGTEQEVICTPKMPQRETVTRFGIQLPLP